MSKTNMTFEETKKHIETEVSGICNDIIDLYYDILSRDEDEFGRDHPFFLNEKKRLNNERDELCKRVKELGQLTQHFRDEIEELRLALQDPDIH